MSLGLPRLVLCSHQNSFPRALDNFSCSMTWFNFCCLTVALSVPSFLYMLLGPSDFLHMPSCLFQNILRGSSLVLVGFSLKLLRQILCLSLLFSVNSSKVPLLVGVASVPPGQVVTWGSD